MWRVLLAVVSVGVCWAQTVTVNTVNGIAVNPQPAGAATNPGVLLVPTTATLVGTRQYTLVIGGTGFPATGIDVALGTTATSCAATSSVVALGCPAPSTTCTSTISNLRTTFQAGGANNDWVNNAGTALDGTNDRALCWRSTAAGGAFAVVPGVVVRQVYDCSFSANSCGAFTAIPVEYSSLTENQRRLHAARSQCCTTTAGFGVGQCVDPFTSSCCGGVGYSVTGQKCCTDNRLVAANGQCPCQRTANGATSTVGCPASEPECCVNEKFMAEFGTISRTGTCFNALTSNRRCCNTGDLYDPSTQQCCVISGVQSIAAPCPCESNAHCAGASIVDEPASRGLATPRTASVADKPLNHVCCMPMTPQITSQNAQCTTYFNFPNPSAAGAANNIQCRGQCIDPSYQICCNGATCRREFEKCCNNTCCNLFVGTCSEGRGNGFKTRSNWVDYNVKYERCTTIEQLDLIKVFTVFIYPTAMLIVTLGGLAIVLAFANKAAYRVFTFIEKCILLTAVVGIIGAVPTFFSPSLKYGFTIVVICLIAIITAAARVRWITIAFIFVTLVGLLYIFDPFHGNDYFNFTPDRIRCNTVTNPAGRCNTMDGQAHPSSNGIFHHTSRFFPTGCPTYYDGYFQIDPILEDTNRYSNPEVTTFGYCNRGWIVAVLFFQALAMIAVFLLALLAVVLLLLRLRKKAAPVELELVPEPVM